MEVHVLNENIIKFMSQFPNEALTFDDVSLVTQYADFLPSETNIRSRLSRNITLSRPFVSAAMDTVTESEMAIAMALNGGIGVIHKNLSPQDQAMEVVKVKKYLNGIIEEPVTFLPDLTIQEVLDEKERRRLNFSGYPIVDAEGRLCGILTARDLRFCVDFTRKVSEVMTKEVITAAPGTNLREAYQIMTSNKIGKLPLVDEQGKLVGLYSFHDVSSILEEEKAQHALASRDRDYRLMVAAAVGPGDEERIELLVQAGADVLVVDTAHGHSRGVL
ncbi:MAG: CBS domain-containing protein, partial [Lentisphaerae bacterium]